jgi:asparagine synthase (glutamine-hydrolysing)
MRDWVAQWLAAHGGPERYFAERAVPLLDAAEVARVVAEDVAAGIRRERLLFALIVLVEWNAAQAARVGALRRRYAGA